MHPLDQTGLVISRDKSEKEDSESLWSLRSGGSTCARWLWWGLPVLNSSGAVQASTACCACTGRISTGSSHIHCARGDREDQSTPQVRHTGTHLLQDRASRITPTSVVLIMGPGGTAWMRRCTEAPIELIIFQRRSTPIVSSVHIYHRLENWRTHLPRALGDDRGINQASLFPRATCVPVPSLPQCPCLMLDIKNWVTHLPWALGDRLHEEVNRGVNQASLFPWAACGLVPSLPQCPCLTLEFENWMTHLPWAFGNRLHEEVDRGVDHALEAVARRPHALLNVGHAGHRDRRAAGAAAARARHLQRGVPVRHRPPEALQPAQHDRHRIMQQRRRLLGAYRHISTRFEMCCV